MFKNIHLALAMFLMLPQLTSAATLRFKIGNGWIEFSEFGPDKVIVNRTCANVGLAGCDALKALDRTEAILVYLAQPERNGHQNSGPNPGAEICSKALLGMSVFGFDAEDDNANQYSFCRFRDGSIIPSGELWRMSRLILNRSN